MIEDEVRIFFHIFQRTKNNSIFHKKIRRHKKADGRWEIILIHHTQPSVLMKRGIVWENEKKLGIYRMMNARKLHGDRIKYFRGSDLLGWRQLASQYTFVPCEKHKKLCGIIFIASLSLSHHFPHCSVFSASTRCRLCLRRKTKKQRGGSCCWTVCIRKTVYMYAWT